jgi:L-lactate utilization protein LutB
MLRCIRCGACMNHCPVYFSLGGHAYGWVYPGPMGSVLTPLIHRSGERARFAACVDRLQPVWQRLPGQNSAA